MIDHGEHSYRGRKRLEGLTALVTDADSSLGRAIAIRVNAIVPGPVCAPRVLEHLPAEAAEAFGAETLQGRAAQPAELAPAFVFLASPAEAAFVNGATLEVTGGAAPPAPALK